MQKFTMYLPILFLFLMFGGLGTLQAQNNTSEQDTITVQIELPNGETTRQDTVAEGDSLELSGLPFPLHIMNGGEIAFSDSSISHDITITITLPGFANVNRQQNQVNFGDSVANAARFKVSAADSTIDPFEFDEPITLTLPVPDNLPPEVGDQVSNLVLSYRDTTGNFDTEGIQTVMRDSVQGIVKAEVSHFSDIVMTSSDETTTNLERRADVKPTKYKLYENYPNPFNPATTIQYDLKSTNHVTLTVYNMIGQKVATLVDKQQQSGQYKVRFDASGLSSGTYFYRLKAGDYTAIQKINLLK